MAFSERSLDDYVDVAQRIADFRALYPHGSLQPLDPAHPWEQAVVQGVTKNNEPFAATMIVYVAAAYRTPDDPRPGIGMAWEVFPGRTPYTLGSELMNAETSAWGRAIIAVLASDSKAGVASRQEVKARRAERDDGLPTNADGSLSRSRTTDEEKAAAGVMTSAQQAEHTALQPKQAEVRGKVRRLSAAQIEQWGAEARAANPDPDPWLDQPAAPLDGTEDQPGTIGPDQQRAMHAAFTQAGIKDRADRLKVTAEIVGRPVTSSNELSYTEAGRVLEALHERVKA